MAGKGSQSPNHREALSAISSITGNNEYVYSTNHALDINVSIAGSPIPVIGATTATVVAIVDGSGNQITSFGGGSVPSSFKSGQASVGTSAAALTSNVLTVGVIIQALSTNSVSVFIGGASVTTSNGFELQPGQATSIAVTNTNTIYAISGSASQGLCFVGS